MKTISIIGNYLVITSGTYILFEIPIIDCYVNRINDIYNIIGLKTKLIYLIDYRDISNYEDSTMTPFNVSSFESFYRTNTGLI